MFYDVFVELCQQKGVKPTTAAVEMGFSKATPTKWKNTGAVPRGETLKTVAAYFGVSEGYLLQTENNQPAVDQDIRFALFHGADDIEISDEMMLEVQRFADYVLQREKDKKKESKVD